MVNQDLKTQNDLRKTIEQNYNKTQNKSPFAKKLFLERFNIPKKTTRIGNHVFWQSVLPRNFKLPASIVNIGTSSFEQAILPKNFKVAKTVKSIGSKAFANVKLQNIKLVTCDTCKWIFNTPLYLKTTCGFCFVRERLSDQDVVVQKQTNVIGDLQSKQETDELFQALKKLRKHY